MWLAACGVTIEQLSANPELQTQDSKSTFYHYSSKNGTILRIAGAGKYPKTCSSILKVKQLRQYTDIELEWMLNEMYARRGYCFNSQKWRAAFEDQDWYTPLAKDIEALFSVTEKSNIVLIKKIAAAELKEDQ